MGLDLLSSGSTGIFAASGHPLTPIVIGFGLVKTDKNKTMPGGKDG